MATAETEFEWNISLGSSDQLEIDYRNEDDTVIDLTGFVVELFGVSAKLQGKVSAVISDPAQGKIVLDLDAIPDLPVHTSHKVRVRLVPPAGQVDAIALPLIKVIAR